jgi:hypothetical protein
VHRFQKKKGIKKYLMTLLKYVMIDGWMFDEAIEEILEELSGDKTDANKGGDQIN